MELDKYYTPEIEEFHIGFKYEYKSDFYMEILNKTSGDWRKEECYFLVDSDGESELNDIEKLIQNKNIRVKYLDKEDIESLGFKKISNNWWSTNLYSDGHQLLKINNNYEISYGRHEVRDILFSGNIKNKSELKKLMKQLKINDIK